jgi:large subunit ribosomal protein L36e
MSESPKTEKPKGEKKEKPKAEKPKVEKKEKPKADKAEKPKVEKAKAEAKPKAAKSEKPKAEKPKGEAKPKAEKPKAEAKPKTEKPKSEKPKATGEKPKTKSTPLNKGVVRQTKKKSPFRSLAIGLKKGYAVKKRAKIVKPAQHKGALTKRVKFVREIVREVSGFAPYERRIMELLRNNLDKRALRLAKKKLGTHSRGKRKRDELSGVLLRMRAGAHH